jgi:hypothetical protein
MARGLVILFVAMWVGASEAAAQDRFGLTLGEELTIRAEAREVTALYVAAGSLLGTAAVMGVLGGLTLRHGDSIGGGVIPLFATPVPATFGLVLLAVAAGYDAGVSAWNGARASAADPAAARAELSNRITWTYAIGGAVLGGAVVALVAMGVYDVTRTGPVAYLERLTTPHFLIPTVIGGLGLFTMLGALGMDVAAGAWSGLSATVAPLDGGVMAMTSGRF